MRKEKGRWLHRLAVAFGTAAAAVMLTQVPAAAREIICKEDTTYQINATETRTVDFISGPIMPGDTLKVEGKQEIYPADNGEPESVVQRVAMDVAAYWYYPKESAATGPFTNHYVTEYPSDGYKAGISNEQLKEALKGLEFVTTKIYNRQGNYVEVISGFVNNTGKILRVAENGEGPGCDNMAALYEYDGEGNCIRTYNLRAKGMIVRIYEPECDLTYDLDGGSMQGKTNPSTYTVATLEPYSVKIWGPVKEGYHCTGMGTSDGRSSLFGNDFTESIEDGQRYFIHEYWPGYFGRFGGTGQNREFRFYFDRGYTAVFHGNGGTVNGQDTWISEVDRDKGSTWPYKYTDVIFTPVREGYQFEGWYLDENFSQRFYRFQDDRTYDKTGHDDWKIPFWTTRTDYITDLYAKWSGGDEPLPSTGPSPSEAPKPSEAPQPTQAPQPSQAPEQNVTPRNTQTPTPAPFAALPKKGSQHKVKGLVYKVTASTASKKTVTVMRPVKKTEKKITIPASIKLGKYTYQVTEINAKAFRNNTRLTQVTIGTKITKIGKQAFEGCKNLKKITIKSKVLKKIQANAFRKVKKGARIYVPRAKYKAYSKYLKAAKITKDIKVIRK